MKPIETNLETILDKTTHDEQINDRFSEFLSRLDSEALDQEIFRLEKIVTPQINCTDCGNCCKSLMVNINEEEADRASIFLNQSREEFDDLYIKKKVKQEKCSSTPFLVIFYTIMHVVFMK